MLAAAFFPVGIASADTTPLVILDPNLQVTTYVGAGLNQPIGIVFIGPNDAFVLEKASGQVKRVIGGVVQPTPVLDLAVNSNSERGLLSLVLHPNFPATPFVYIRWTESSTGADSGVVSEVPLLGNRVDRFIWNGSTLTLDRNLISLRSRQTDNVAVTGHPGTTNAAEQGNHNGGVLRFGPDGKLYLFMGDQGRRGWLQNLPNGPFLTATAGGRHIRRAGAGQRPLHGRDSAAQRRRHDARGQSVLRGRRGDGRRGRREHPEDLLLRPPQRLRHGVRPVERQSLGDRERRRRVQRAEPDRAGNERRMDPARRTAQPDRRLQVHRNHAVRQRHPAGPISADARRLHGGPGARPHVHAARAPSTAIRNSAGGTRSAPRARRSSAAMPWDRNTTARCGSVRPGVSNRWAATAAACTACASRRTGCTSTSAPTRGWPTWSRTIFSAPKSSTARKARPCRSARGFGTTPDIEQGPDGDLYVVNLTDNVIYRISRIP